MSMSAEYTYDRTWPISISAIAKPFCVFAVCAMIDWDDLRFVLAVARAGSALRAAHALGVNQTTVMRRIAHVEAGIGAELFERQQSGYRLTPLGQRVATAADRIDSEVMTLERAIEAEQRLLSGSVRVTTSEAFANFAITPLLKKFHEQHPAILVELIADDRRLDLAGGEADIAVRGSSSPEGVGIVARRLPHVAWSVYCNRAYADEHGVPATLQALDGHAVVGAEGTMANLPGPLWLARAAPNSKISARSNSLTNLVAALKAGLGIATLPCLVGDADPDLVRCLPPVAELDAEFWLIVREDVKSVPHVRAFADFLWQHVQGLRMQLAGG
jgi:DNA-binding transcriptional LysR family regulator